MPSKRKGIKVFTHLVSNLVLLSHFENDSTIYSLEEKVLMEELSSITLNS